MLPIDTRYNKWKIIEFWDKKGKHKRYKVVCDCGFIAIRYLRDLRKERTRSCRPCSFIARTGKRANFDALEIGTVVNNWTVLFMHLKENKEKVYLCKCKCGTIQEVKHTNLHLNNSSSCRKCNMKRIYKYEDFIGQIFGNSKVLKLVPIPNKTAIYYEVECLICNRTRILAKRNLLYERKRNSNTACNKCAAKKRAQTQKNKNVQSNTKT